MNEKFILDACCGGRMMWFTKHHPNTLYIDIRKEEFLTKQGHMKELIVNPDIVADFRDLSFLEDKSFKLVVCDPPHLTQLGKTSLYKKMFGQLNAETWQYDLKKGFSEMWRVLDDYGVLIIKWNDYEIKFKELSKYFPAKPLFGNIKNGSGKSSTMWFCFMKMPLAVNKKEDGLPPTSKEVAIRPTIL